MWGSRLPARFFQASSASKRRRLLDSSDVVQMDDDESSDGEWVDSAQEFGALWPIYGNSPLHLLARVLRQVFSQGRGIPLGAKRSRFGAECSGIHAAALDHDIESVSLTRYLRNVFFGSGAFALGTASSYAQRLKERVAHAAAARAKEARLSTVPRPRSARQARVKYTVGYVNVAYLKRPVAALRAYIGALVNIGSIKLSTLSRASSGSIPAGIPRIEMRVDVYGDGKGTGLQAMNGCAYLLAWHLIDVNSPQSLSSILPIAINCGISDHRSTLGPMMSSIRLRRRMQRSRPWPIAHDGVTYSVKLVSDFKADYPGVLAVCPEVSPCNGVYPTQPSRYKQSAPWVPKPNCHWVRGRPCCMCDASYLQMYTASHPSFDVVRTPSCFLPVRCVRYALFHGLTNAIDCGFIADLCRFAADTRGKDTRLVKFLVRVFRDREFASGHAPEAADGELAGRKWLPLEKAAKGARTLSMHYAEHTLVHTRARSSVFWAEILAGIPEAVPGAWIDCVTRACTSFQKVVFALYSQGAPSAEYRASMQRAGRLVWRVWVAMASHLQPASGPAAVLGCVVKPSGLGLSPTGHALLCHVGFHLRDRDTAGSFENVGEHALKRLAQVWSMNGIGNLQNHNRPTACMVNMVAVALVCGLADEGNIFAESVACKSYTLQ